MAYKLTLGIAGDRQVFNAGLAVHLCQVWLNSRNPGLRGQIYHLKNQPQVTSISNIPRLNKHQLTREMITGLSQCSWPGCNQTDQTVRKPGVTTLMVHTPLTACRKSGASLLLHLQRPRQVQTVGLEHSPWKKADSIYESIAWEAVGQQDPHVFPEGICDYCEEEEEELSADYDMTAPYAPFPFGQIPTSTLLPNLMKVILDVQSLTSLSSHTKISSSSGCSGRGGLASSSSDSSSKGSINCGSRHSQENLPLVPSSSLQTLRSFDREVKELEDRLVFPQKCLVFQPSQEDRHIIFQGDVFHWSSGQWAKVRFISVFSGVICSEATHSWMLL
ncbi:hypothetical protein C0Q70_17682 [Pomacea canaliculata]|uniref:Uncharacterized protein n=1 Tax=Pomacea canaliculata TaxID=400727 RepID=A0A2T7NL41_POMCA|nr:hypothetical protein C0Q70_17682 [Pomacea canaliculata]